MLITNQASLGSPDSFRFCDLQMNQQDVIKGGMRQFLYLSAHFKGRHHVKTDQKPLIGNIGPP